MSHSLDNTMRRSRQLSHSQSSPNVHKEKPVAQCRLMIDGEQLTFKRYGEDKHITKELRAKSGSRSNPRITMQVQTQPFLNLRPNTPPYAIEENTR